MEKTFTLSVADSRKLAHCFGWPIGKNPKFEFTNEDGYLMGAYDADLDYQKDGHTFECEFSIDDPFSSPEH